jgi:transaldolase
VTAIFTADQIEMVLEALNPAIPSYISVFAGRIADTGLDPVPIMSEAVSRLGLTHSSTELIWASPREALNVFQANEIGCHIITATGDIIKKLDLAGKNLADFSLETVRMFYDDATAAGFKL